VQNLLNVIGDGHLPYLDVSCAGMVAVVDVGEECVITPALESNVTISKADYPA
jgi:hypothetical protein